MPQGKSLAFENNFAQGYKTEYTGLNFPPHAVTATSNVVYERIGNAHRRSGINYESSFSTSVVTRSGSAINTYRWKNVGGDGATQLLVVQVGKTLSFYKSSNATIASPLSTTKLAGTIDLSAFGTTGVAFDATSECQFADGNGFLFVYHYTLDPFYVSFNPAGSVLTPTIINLQIRDFTGIPEPGVADTFRPASLTAEHAYNLSNQGWTTLGAWTGLSLNPTNGLNAATQSYILNSQSTTNTVTNGAIIQVVFAGTYTNPVPIQFTVTKTFLVNFYNITQVSGTLLSYTDSLGGALAGFAENSSVFTGQNAALSLVTTGQVTTWFAALGNYPSNSDVWFEFKNTSGVFDPAHTLNNVTADNAPAAKGHFIFNPFNQNRSVVSGQPVFPTTTTVRPTNGCFFQGRVWYTGVNAAFQATLDAPYYTWTENIYFSQILAPGRIDQFGKCYQKNDPTSETLSDLLPDDGGVIVIQGCGAIYKLFPIQNGIIVFAANGIWFVTGNGPAGAFYANAYSITKISAVTNMSSTSYVDVQGLPFWWNEEAIYTLKPSQGGNSPYGLSGWDTEPITIATIQTFYQAIPYSSKTLARGTYDPLEWIVRWVYKSIQSTGVEDSYNFDSVLCFNMVTKAFYTYTLPDPNSSPTPPTVNSIQYVQNPGGVGTPIPIVKYISTKLTSGSSYSITFAEENDTTNWVDFISDGITGGVPYTSTFTTGFRLPGEAAYKTQIGYLNLYLNNYTSMSYKIQGNWDFSISKSSGKWTPFEERSTTLSTSFAVERLRHKVPGRGLAYQFTVQSEPNLPFDIIGWTTEEKVNQGP